MAFPVSPTEGQTYTENNTVWIYSAVTGQWNRSVINPLNETLYVFGSASATGAAGEIQYTDGSRLAASPNLVWDDVNDELEVGGDVVLDDGGTFTTTLQTVTPTANRTISFPDATGTVGLVAGSSGQLVYNNAGAYAGVSTMTFDGTSVTLAGRLINSYTSVASSPAKVFTGTWFTGGTSTTTKPHFLIEPAGATSTAWSTSGTGLGVNAASGFTGRLLDLQLNGTSRAVVTGGGQLLVGTATSPAGGQGSISKVVVQGYVGDDANIGILSLQRGEPASSITANEGIGEIAFNDSTGNRFASIQASADANAGAGDYPGRLIFSTTADGASTVTERARIDSSGRLGIGTASPSNLLTVSGTGTIAKFVGSGGDVSLAFQNSTSNAGYLQYTADNLTFWTNNTERFRVDSSGNVGIGTNAPTTLLDVNANTVRVRTARTPASATATGATGEICWDANYIYVCTATNTWKRTALSTW